MVNLFNTDSIALKTRVILMILAALICALLYLNDYISEQTHEFDLTKTQYEDVDRETLELELALRNLTADDPHAQKEILERLKKTEDAFDELFKERYVRQDSTHFLDSVSFSYQNLDEEQKILLECNEFFDELYPICDELSYKTISKDSVQQLYSSKTVFNRADSTQKHVVVVEDNKIRVLTNYSKEQTRRASIIAGAFKKELSALELIYDLKIEQINNYRYYFNYLLAFILILCLFLFYQYLKRHIFTPLKKIHHVVNSPDKYSTYESLNDDTNLEISRLARAYGQILKEINLSTKFIGGLSGSQSQVKLSAIAELGSPLSQSIVQLNKKLEELESQRKANDWSLKGQAVFAELVTQYNDNFEILVEEVTKQFVKTLDAKQGVLYVINRSLDIDSMDVKSCYAYAQKKTNSSSFTKGEGLIGQVWQEERSLYLKDIPEDHPNIKSGLGDAAPVSLLIVPLKTHSIVYGVLELASFKYFTQYEIEFVEKVGESIAATISIVEINDHTQLLLLDAEKSALRMKEKEDENQIKIIELKNQQEDAQRKEIQKDREQKIVAEKYDEQILSLNHEVLNFQDKITKLNEDVEFAANNSEKVTELNSLVETMKSEVGDLKETIKIKDMRIDKLRKRLQKPGE